jgi:hypothetical protein
MSWDTGSFGVSGVFGLSESVSGVVYALDDSTTAKVLKSSDGGHTWEQVGSLYHGRAIAQAPDGTLYQATNPSGYIYKSVDGGATWTPITSSGENSWYDISAAENGNIYAAVYGGYLYKSTDSGTSWTQMGTAKPWVSVCSVGTRLIGLTTTQVFYSDDLGDTWDLAAWPGDSWFRARSHDGVLFACKAYSTIHRSTDLGATWEDLEAAEYGWALSVINTGSAIFGNRSSGVAQIYTLTVDPPTIYPPTGSYTGSQMFGIVSAPGTYIRFTTDGSAPTVSSEIWTRGLKMRDGMTVKAIALADGDIPSEVASATYSLTGDKIQPIPSYTAHVLPYLLEQYKGDNP